MTMIRTLTLSTILCLSAAQFVPFTASAQQPSRDITKEEQALCRNDAIRFCFFKISDAEALRACLRANKPDLAPACRKLIESRGN
jgi:hypothetical protein